MKIVEALKKVKHNREKVADLQKKIHMLAAHMESGAESLPYKNPKEKVAEWTQGVFDILQNNAKLLTQIQETNLKTPVTIELDDGVQVTKTIAEWIVRRREGVDMELSTYNMMSTRLTQRAYEEDGKMKIDNVVYNFDVEKRDKRLHVLSSEKYKIDSALEVVNATTDLVE